MPFPFPFFSKFASIDNLDVTRDAIGDYSTPTDFSVGPAAGVVWDVHRVMVYIEDAGTFNASGYGALAALTNGISAKIYRNGVMVNDLIDGETVKTNTRWKAVCFDIAHSEFGVGNANESLGVRWTFSKSGIPLTLVGDDSDEIRMGLADDFTGLIHHTFLFQGHVIQPNHSNYEP